MLQIVKHTLRSIVQSLGLRRNLVTTTTCHAIGFLLLPTDTGRKYEWAKYKLRKKFITAIQRKHFSDEAIRFFSRHFVSSKPAGMHDVTNPDWLPTLYLDRREEGNEYKAVLKTLENVTRYERAKQRETQSAGISLRIARVDAASTIYC